MEKRVKIRYTTEEATQFILDLPSDSELSDLEDSSDQEANLEELQMILMKKMKTVTLSTMMCLMMMKKKINGIYFFYFDINVGFILNCLFQNN